MENSSGGTGEYILGLLSWTFTCLSKIVSFINYEKLPPFKFSIFKFSLAVTLFFPQTLAFGSADVYIISSKPSLKIRTGNFIFDFKPFLRQGKMAVLYLEDNPNFCVATLGQFGASFGMGPRGPAFGKSYNYFYWTKTVEIIEENDSLVLVKAEGEREGYWSYTAFLTFFKSFPGLFRLKIIVNSQEEMLLMGGLPQFISMDRWVRKIPGFKLVLRSNAHGFMPLVVNLEDNAGRYLFSISWLELSGKESIYGALKEEFKFHFDESAFGLLPPGGKLSPGSFVSADYFVYAWRNPSDNIAGLFTFLKAITPILGAQLTAKDYSESLDMASALIHSLLHPKVAEAVYAKGETGIGLKTYLWNRGQRRKEKTEFVTNVNVLLGSAYCYSKTKNENARKLCELIVDNLENFNGYYVDERGFYRPGWGQPEYEAVDPWGFIGCPLMLITAHSLLPEVIPIDIEKMENHAKQCIFIARKNNYDFPISVYPLTGRPDKNYGEAKKWDVSILYAKFMLEICKLTNDKKYLKEAKTAFLHYMKQNYGKMCGSNTDAVGLSVALELYEHTKDKIYLHYFKQLCYQLIRWVTLFRGSFVDKEIPFTLVSSTPGSYSAPFESGLFKYFLEEPYNKAYELMDEHPELSQFFEPYFILYNFYGTFAPYCARYAFPQILGLPNQPAEGGKIDRDYWVPIEDLRPVYDREPWEFTRGQQIYGAGSQIIDLMPRFR